MMDTKHMQGLEIITTQSRNCIECQKEIRAWSRCIIERHPFGELYRSTRNVVLFHKGCFKGEVV